MSNLSDNRLEWHLIAPVFAVISIDSMGMGVILPLLPFYAERFGATPFLIGLLFATFALCQFVAGPLLGSLSDRIGRKPVLVGSQLGTCASFVVLAVSSSLPMVFLARVLDGLTSGNLSVAAAYAVDRSTPKTRKQAIGVVSAGVGVGLIVGPALSALSAHVSPEAPIWIAASLSAASLLATIALLPAESPKAVTAQESNQPRAMELLASKSIVAILGLLSCFYVAIGMMMGGLAVFLANRFTWQGHFLGATEVGIIFVGTGIINILVQLVLMKHVGKHFTDKQLTVACFMLMAVGYAASGAVQALALLGLALGAAALGSSLLRPTLTSALSLCAPAGRQGVLLGFNQSLMAIANIVGPLIGGLMLDRGWYSGWVFALAALLASTALAALTCFTLGWWPSNTSTVSQTH